MKGQDQVRIMVHVQPNAKQDEIKEVGEGFIKIGIVAPPIKGKANKELVAFLIHILGVRKGDIKIVEGIKSKQKVIAIHGLSKEQIMHALSKRGE